MNFQIDNGNTYKGFTDGQKWNGWECPYFPFEVALQIAKDMSSFSDELVYDISKDAFTYRTEDYPDCEHDIFSPVLINSMKLYPIGAMSWCWDGEPA